MDDLDEILNHSIEQWGVKQAEIYAFQVRNSLALLAENPEIGRRCDDIRPGYLRFPVGSHTVFYRRRILGIWIVRILHNRMDHQRHLQ